MKPITLIRIEFDTEGRPVLCWSDGSSEGFDPAQPIDDMIHINLVWETKKK